MNSNKDLEKLIQNLPFFIQEYLRTHSQQDKLIEIILDLGRRPEARFIKGSEYLSQKVISWQDIDFITKRIGKFSSDNRAGVERTLHRISCIRNRQFLINGLTCRIGRVIRGTISVIRDLLESRYSILILGRPGVGKTTIIREIGRVLADEMEKRVIIVDTSNEIAGESDVAHLGIGQARRMQVSKTEFQHQIMIEAVENHMPQVIIIDEISNELEVLAAKTIAEKGIQLIGTTHGTYLENLIKNPFLSNLIGGVQYVTLSDEEARRRGTQKSILERKSYPSFDIVIEINRPNTWTIHENISYSVDLLLRNSYGNQQLRKSIITGKTEIKCQVKQNSFNFATNLKNSNGNQNSLDSRWLFMNIEIQNESVQSKVKQLVIYCYSISNNFIKEACSKMGIDCRVTNSLHEATLIIGLKKSLTQNLKLKELANRKQIPVYSVRQLSMYQLFKLFKSLEI